MYLCEAKSAAEVEDRLQEIVPSIAEASTLCAVLGTSPLKMKEIPLTKGLVALVDDDDYLQLPPGRWHAVNGYATKMVRGRTISLHRFIMGVLDDPSVQIDHINGIRTDCQKANLRKCTHLQNAWNKAGTGKTKYKRVSWDKKINRWTATICVNYKQVRIGWFEDCEEAARHYNLRAVKEFGEYARLNDVSPLFPESSVVKRLNLYKIGASGLRGVRKSLNKWRASIEAKGVPRIGLGTFDSADAAARAYDKKARELHGAKAVLNFPEDVAD